VDHDVEHLRVAQIQDAPSIAASSFGDCAADGLERVIIAIAACERRPAN